MDSWPAFWKHNKPLYEAMLAEGCSFKRNVTAGLSSFRDANGEYVDYPVGYITGPCFQDNGNRKPWYASIKGSDGWRQRSFADRDDAINWALAEASGDPRSYLPPAAEASRLDWDSSGAGVWHARGDGPNYVHWYVSVTREGAYRLRAETYKKYSGPSIEPEEYTTLYEAQRRCEFLDSLLPRDEGK